MAKKTKKDMKTQQSIQSIIDRLQSNASVKTVYGDPVETQGKTIIPVGRIAYGFGGGFGEGEPDEEEHPTEGGGGGAGILVHPVGVVEVTEEQTKFVPLNSMRRLLGAATLGGILALLLRRIFY